MSNNEDDNSSALLSIDSTNSEEEENAGNNLKLTNASFHQYLDEVAGSLNGDSSDNNDDDQANNDRNLSYDTIDQELGISPQVADMSRDYQQLTPGRALLMSPPSPMEENSPSSRGYNSASRRSPRRMESQQRGDMQMEDDPEGDDKSQVFMEFGQHYDSDEEIYIDHDDSNDSHDMHDESEEYEILIKDEEDLRKSIEASRRTNNRETPTQNYKSNFSANNVSFLTTSTMNDVDATPFRPSSTRSSDLVTPRGEEERNTFHRTPTLSSSITKRKKQHQEDENQILSPFSPKARKLRRQQKYQQYSVSNSPATINTPSPSVATRNTNNNSINWSMEVCRKVTILVNVASPFDNSNSPPLHPENDNGPNSVCLFPNVEPQSSHGSVTSGLTFNTHATTSYKTGPGQEMILVNPDAFGKLLPPSVTVDTARLVAQVSSKVSEDWVRKYKFDEVCWPPTSGMFHQNLGKRRADEEDIHATMGAVSKAVVNHAVCEGKNSVLVGHGTADSGRLGSIFGSIVTGKRPRKVQNDEPNQALVGRKFGLLGQIITTLLEQKQNTESNVNFTLSMVEIVEDDVLRDLLAPSSSSPSKKSNSMKSSPNQRNKEVTLQIRHPDRKGAIIQNAVEADVQSLQDLRDLMTVAFFNEKTNRARRMEGGRGHIIVTLRVQSDKNNSTTNKALDYNSPLIQLVDLACAKSDEIKSLPVKLNKLEMARIQERRTACIRKSLSCLRGILRGLIVYDAKKSQKTMSFRECTLTKLLQRALDNSTSRVVVLSSVCPKRSSYAQTVNTLNYINRLLVRPNQTAEFPFGTKADSTFGSVSPGGSPFMSPSGDVSIASSQASDAIRSEFTNAKADSVFLKSLLSDPRQRLATLLSNESPAKNRTDVSGVPMKEITTINEGGEYDSLIGDDDNFDPVMKTLENVNKGGTESNDEIGFESYDDPYEMGDESKSGTGNKEDFRHPEDNERTTSFSDVLPKLDALEDALGYSDDMGGIISEEGEGEEEEKSQRDRSETWSHDNKNKKLPVPSQNNIDSKESQSFNSEEHLTSCEDLEEYSIPEGNSNDNKADNSDSENERRQEDIQSAMLDDNLDFNSDEERLTSGEFQDDISISEEEEEKDDAKIFDQNGLSNSEAGSLGKWPKTDYADDNMINPIEKLRGSKEDNKDSQSHAEENSTRRSLNKGGPIVDKNHDMGNQSQGEDTGVHEVEEEIPSDEGESQSEAILGEYQSFDYQNEEDRSQNQGRNAEASLIDDDSDFDTLNKHEDSGFDSLKKHVEHADGGWESKEKKASFGQVEGYESEDVELESEDDECVEKDEESKEKKASFGQVEGYESEDAELESEGDEFVEGDGEGKEKEASFGQVKGYESEDDEPTNPPLENENKVSNSFSMHVRFHKPNEKEGEQNSSTSQGGSQAYNSGDRELGSSHDQPSILSANFKGENHVSKSVNEKIQFEGEREEEEDVKPQITLGKKRSFERKKNRLKRHDRAKNENSSSEDKSPDQLKKNVSYSRTGTADSECSDRELEERGDRGDEEQRSKDGVQNESPYFDDETPGFDSYDDHVAYTGVNKNDEVESNLGTSKVVGSQDQDVDIWGQSKATKSPLFDENQKITNSFEEHEDISISDGDREEVNSETGLSDGETYDGEDEESGERYHGSPSADGSPQANSIQRHTEEDFPSQVDSNISEDEEDHSQTGLSEDSSIEYEDDYAPLDNYDEIDSGTSGSSSSSRQLETIEEEQSNAPDLTDELDSSIDLSKKESDNKFRSSGQAKDIKSEKREGDRNLPSADIDPCAQATNVSDPRGKVLERKNKMNSSSASPKRSNKVKIRVDLNEPLKATDDGAVNEQGGYEHNVLVDGANFDDDCPSLSEGSDLSNESDEQGRLEHNVLLDMIQRENENLNDECPSLSEGSDLSNDSQHIETQLSESVNSFENTPIHGNKDQRLAQKETGQRQQFDFQLGDPSFAEESDVSDETEDEDSQSYDQAKLSFREDKGKAELLDDQDVPGNKSSFISSRASQNYSKRQTKQEHYEKDDSSYKEKDDFISLKNDQINTTRVTLSAAKVSSPTTIQDDAAKKDSDESEFEDFDFKVELDDLQRQIERTREKKKRAEKEYKSIESQERLQGNVPDMVEMQSENYQSDDVSKNSGSGQSKEAQNASLSILEEELEKLETSMTDLMHKTDEHKVIEGLAEDQSQLQQSLDSYLDGNSITRKNSALIERMKKATFQCEAMKSYVSSTLDQLEKARRAERKANEEIVEIETQRDKTLDQVHSLKLSSKDSIDNVKQDHLRALQAVKDAYENTHQDEINELQKSLQEEKQRRNNDNDKFQQKISSLQTQVTNFHKQIDEEELDQRNLEKAHEKEMEELKICAEKAKAKEKELLDEVQALKSNREIVLDNNDGLVRKVASMEKEMAGLQMQLHEELGGRGEAEKLYSTKVEALKRSVAEAGSKQKHLLHDMISLQDKNESLIASNDDFKNKVSSMEQEMTNLRNQLEHEDASRAELDKKHLSDMEELRKSLANTGAKEKELLNTVQSLNKEKNGLLNNNDDLVEKVTSMEEEMTNLRKQLEAEEVNRFENEKDYEAEMQRLKRSINNATMKEKEFLDSIQSLNDENEDLTGSNDDLTSKIVFMEEEITNLQKRIDEEELDKDDLEEAHKAELNELKSSVKEAGAKEKKLLDEIQALKSNGENILNNNDNLERKVASMEKDMTDLQSQLEGEQTGRTAARKAHSLEVKALKKSIINASLTAKELGDKLSSLQDENEDLYDKNDELGQKIESMEEEVINLEKQVAKEEALRIESEKEQIAVVEDLKKTISEANTKEKELLDSLQSMNEENEDLLENNNDFTNKVTSMEEEMMNLRRQLEDEEGDRAEEKKMYITKVQTLKKSIVKANAKEKEFLDKLSSIKDENEGLMTNNDDLRGKIKSMEENAENLKRQLEDEEAYRVKAQKEHGAELDVLKKSIKKAGMKEKEFRVTLGMLRDENKDIKNKNNRLTKNIASSEEQLQDVKSRLRDTEASRIEVEKTYNTEIEALKRSASEIGAEKNQLLQDLSSLRDENEDLTCSNEDFVNKLSSMEEEMLAIQSSFKKEETCRIDLEKAHALKIEDLTKSISELTMNEKELHHKLTTLEEEKQSLMDSNESTAEKQISMEKTIRNLREQLEEQDTAKTHSDETHKFELKALKRSITRASAKEEEMILKLKASKDENTKLMDRLHTQDAERDVTNDELKSLRDQIQQEHEENEKQIEIHASHLETLTNDAAKKDEMNLTLTKDLDATNRELLELKDLLESTRKQIQELESTHGQENTSLVENLQRSDEDKKKLERKLATANKEKENLSKDVETEVAARLKAMRELKKLKQIRETENQKSEGETKKKDDDMKKLARDLSKTRNMLNQKDRSVKDLKENNSDLQEKLKEVEASTQTAGTAHEEEKLKLLNNIEKLKEKMTKRTNDIGSKESIIESKELELSRLKESLLESRSEVDSLKSDRQQQTLDISKKLDVEIRSRKKSEEKHLKMKEVMAKNEEYMRSEVSELKKAMDQRISRMEEKKALSEQKLQKALEEEKAAAAKKIADLQEALREQKDAESNREEDRDEEKDLLSEIRAENLKLREKISKLEMLKPRSSPREVDGIHGEEEFYRLLEQERAHRIKAEEFAAAMAARAKAGFEERNEKIVKLKMKLNLATNAKRAEYIGLLSDGTDVPVYGELHDELAMVLRERDEARAEAKKYRTITTRMHQQITDTSEVDHRLEHQQFQSLEEGARERRTQELISTARQGTRPYYLEPSSVDEGKNFR